MDLTKSEAKQQLFFRNMAKLHAEHRRREQIDEFNDWVYHYRNELQDMYEKCVSVNIPFRRFVKLAYRCSLPMWSKKQHKYIRPLM